MRSTKIIKICISSLCTCLHHMVILRTRNKITDFVMILAWASPFKLFQYEFLKVPGPTAPEFKKLTSLNLCYLGLYHLKSIIFLHPPFERDMYPISVYFGMFIQLITIISYNNGFDQAKIFKIFFSLKGSTLRKIPSFLSFHQPRTFHEYVSWRCSQCPAKM